MREKDFYRRESKIFMKQLFAIFCAVCLMPSMTSFGWVGGPFSNNTYFGENGDDGVYEAVAVPTSPGTRNGIGLFRWGVTNDFPGLNPANITSFRFTRGDAFTDFTIPVSGNVQFSGVSTFNHSWFLRGVFYTGFCNGTVNSGIGFVSATGVASSTAGITGTVESISSSFRARFTNEGDGIVVRRFEGRGRASSTVDAFGQFRFFAFGSKVHDGVQYFGLNPDQQ